MAPNVNIIWASLLVDECRRGGVRHVCLSPGSRSGPLAVAAARHGDLQVHVHVDERSAAFFALGVAKASGVPAALICTSGTAAANYLPAIVEASLSRTPLIVITADRPPELRQAGAPQTIDQIHLYGSLVRFFFDLPVPEASPSLLRALVSTAAHAIAKACGTPSGPVHLNVPMREPLAPIELDAPLDAGVIAFLEAREADPRPQMNAFVSGEPAEGTLATLEAFMRPARHGIIVCGPGAPDEPLADAVRALSARTGYPVLSDIASAVGRAPFAVPHADLFLRSRVFRRIVPEITLEIGAPPTSKALQQYLDRDGIERIRLQDHGERLDPDHRVRMRFEGSASSMLARLAERLEGMERSPEWRGLFENGSRIAAREVSAAFESGAGPLEGASLARAVAALPAGSNLYVSNSMPVRDADAFVNRLASDVRVLVNRGANGIDGLVSSAAGAVAATGRPTLIVTGDLAFIHDTNGLAAVRGAGGPVVVFVINNDGGGIFSFLPIAEFEDVFEPYFASPHGLSFERAATLHGLDYALAASLADVEPLVTSSFARGCSSVIEIVSDRARNVHEHRELWSRVAAAVDAELRWLP